MYFGSQYSTCQTIVGRDAHHSLRTVPLFQVAACEYFHASTYLAVRHDGVGGAIHVVNLFHIVGKNKRITDVDIVDVQG